MKFELFRGTVRVRHDRGKWEERQSDDWYWRLRAPNGRIVAIGAEPFASKSSARRSFKALVVGLRVHTYSVVEVTP